MPYQSATCKEKKHAAFAHFFKKKAFAHFCHFDLAQEKW